VLLAGYAVLLAACTGGKPAAPVRAAVGLGGPAAMSLLAAPGRLVDRPVVSTGCGHHPAVRPGTTALLRVAVPPAAAAGARQREFRLHVPADYDPRRPVPLVLAFHGGGGGTGIGMQQASGLSVLADQRGFLAAYPQGLAQDHGKGPAGWDVSALGTRSPRGSRRAVAGAVTCPEGARCRGSPRSRQPVPCRP